MQPLCKEFLRCLTSSYPGTSAEKTEAQIVEMQVSPASAPGARPERSLSSSPSSAEKERRKPETLSGPGSSPEQPLPTSPSSPSSTKRAVCASGGVMPKQRDPKARSTTSLKNQFAAAVARGRQKVADNGLDFNGHFQAEYLGSSWIRLAWWTCTGSRWIKYDQVILRSLRNFEVVIRCHRIVMDSLLVFCFHDLGY